MGSLTHRPHQIQCPKCASRKKKTDEICYEIPSITSPSGKNQALCALQHEGQHHASSQDPPPSVTASNVAFTALAHGDDHREAEQTEKTGVKQRVDPPVHPPVMGTQLASRHRVQSHYCHAHPQWRQRSAPTGPAARFSRLPRHRPRRSASGPMQVHRPI